MMKKFLAALLAALLVTVPALAAEPAGPVERPEPLPMDPVEGDEAQLSDLMPLAVETWTGGESYGDQLRGLARDVYDRLVEAFATDTIQYGNFSAFKESPYCAYYEGDWTPYYGTDVKSYAEEHSQEVKLAYYAFHLDHPEYFWIRLHGLGWMSWRYSGNQAILVIRVGYVLHPDYQSPNARRGYQSNVNMVVQSILDDCSTMSRTAQLAYFDEWLAEHNVYNHDAADTDGYIDQDQTPWNTIGAFLESSPVCEGYAKAFQLLCHRIGVPCLLLSSKGHMWNAVQLDGRWYFMDCTWNDTDDENQDYTDRDYFLIHLFQDNRHNINQTMPAPPIADHDYFDRLCYSIAELPVTEDLVPNCWTALYNENGKMLGLTGNEILPWGKRLTDGTYAENRLLPIAEESLLQSAASGRTFLLDIDGSPLATAADCYMGII